MVASLAVSEPNREFIQAIKGDIREAESNIAVGRISAGLVLVGRVADAGEDLFEIMDDESSELADYHIALFKADDCDYKDAIRWQFVDVLGLDLLIINEVAIEATFRGKGLGLLAVSKTIDIFGDNCGLVAMKPFPMQFKNYLDPGWHPPEGVEDPEIAFRAATKKLRSYWSRAGFRRVGGTNYYALSPARKRPALRRIVVALCQSAQCG